MAAVLVIDFGSQVTQLIAAQETPAKRGSYKKRKAA